MPQLISIFAVQFTFIVCSAMGGSLAVCLNIAFAVLLSVYTIVVYSFVFSM